MKENRPTDGDARAIVSIERQILRALCSDNARAETGHFVRELSSYSWRDPEHATVFQAIRSLAARGRTSWRDELPAEVTRMGFPDVEWPRYLAAAKAQEFSMRELIACLLSFGEQPPKS